MPFPSHYLPYGNHYSNMRDKFYLYNNFHILGKSESKFDTLITHDYYYQWLRLTEHLPVYQTQL